MVSCCMLAAAIRRQFKWLVDLPRKQKSINYFNSFILFQKNPKQTRELIQFISAFPITKPALTHRAGSRSHLLKIN